MKKSLLRMLALLCCLVLLPVMALADFSYAAKVSFEMNADAYPEEDRETLQGIADLLNVLDVDLEAYTHDKKGNNFDIRAYLTVNDNEATRTFVRLCGRMSHWNLMCDLLGDTRIMINTDALLEFAAKADDLLGIPIQYLCAAICYEAQHNATYLIQYALKLMFLKANDRSTTENGVTTLDRDYVMEMAQYLCDTYQNEYGITSFVDAILMPNGLDTPVYGFFDSLPDWIDELMGDGSVMMTKQDNGSMTVYTQDYTIFTYTVTDTGTSFVLDLPMTWDQWKLDASGSTDCADSMLNITLVDDYGDEAFNVTLTM